MSNRFSDGGVAAGSTGVSASVVLRKTVDSTEQAGVAFGSASASYWRQGSAPVAITTAALTAATDAWASGGWFEVGSSQPGAYRLDVPDAAWAAGADWVQVAVVVAGCFVFLERFALAGDLALVAAAAGSVTLAAGDPDRGSTGLIGSRVYVTGGAQGGTSATFTGNPAAGVATVGAWTQGTPAAGSPYVILPPAAAGGGGGTAQTGDVFALVNPLVSAGALTAPALANVPKTGYSLATSQAFNTTGTVGGVTGAVGSVTGAVGSVAGNVGGNVVGSVGSVTGNVGGSVASVANISTVALDSGAVASSPAPSATTFSSTSATLTATQSGAYVGSGIVFQTTTSLGRVRRVVTGHAVVAGTPARHDFTVATSSGTTPLVGPATGDTFEVC